MKKTLTVLGAIATSLTVFAGVSQALPANNGYGWKIKTSDGIAWGLKHNFNYTIKFVNTDSRSKSRPYMINTVNYLNNMTEMKTAKIHFNLTEQIGGLGNFNKSWYNKENAWCNGDFGVIYVITKWKPTGIKNQSVTHSCYRTSDKLSRGGYIIMDAEYWSYSQTTRWGQSTRNIHAHELGHILGFDHPNPKYYIAGHPIPVMNPTAGGYMNSNAGKYPVDETRGINMLIRNGS